MELADLVAAVMNGDALGARQWVLDASSLDWSSVPLPRGLTGDALIIAAGLAELLAERQARDAPEWTRQVGGVSEPLCLVRNAGPRMRRRLETESPAPLMRRNLLAPPDYLRAA